MSFMLLITAGYFLIVGPLSERFPHSEPTSAGRKVMFVAGMFLMHLAQGDPSICLDTRCSASIC